MSAERTGLFFLLCAAALSPAASGGEKSDGREFVISDFTDAEADGAKWFTGDSGAVEMSVEPRSATDTNNMLKVVFKSGRWPGIGTRPPSDWSPFEVFRFVVWTRSPVSLGLRVDDPHSTGYETRYNRTFKLEPGRNLCQVDVSDVARKIDVKNIKALYLFTSSPPPGLTLYFDDVVLGPRLTEKVPFIPYEKRKDLLPTLSVVTPHIPFARNLSGGPLKAFFITGVAYGREVPEMMERMDLDVSQLTWDRNWDQNTWGFGDFYGQRGHRFDYVLMQRYLASSLQGPEKFDVMVLCTPQGWARFPKGAREALLRRVREGGEGLVLVMPYPGERKHRKWQDDLRSVSALVDSDTDWPTPSGYMHYALRGRVRGERWRKTVRHPITEGVPLEALPFESMEIQHYEPAPGAEVLIETENGHPVLAVKRFGKGRVATFAWRSRALTPDILDPEAVASTHPYRYWEVIYSLMVRAAFWASGRDFAREGEPETVETPPGFRDGNISALRWKDASGKTTDWELVFTPPKASPVSRLEVSVPEWVERGKDVPVRLGAVPEGCGISISLIERWGERERMLERKTFSAGKWPEEGSILSSAKVRLPLAVVRAEARGADGVLEARGEAEVLVPPSYAPGESRWKGYELLMWPVDGLPFLRRWEDALMKKVGVTGVMFTGWRNRAALWRWARAGLRLMPHTISHRNKLHLYNFEDILSKWNKTHDRSLLVRRPSYADPEFLSSEREYFAGAVKSLLPFNPTNYLLSDEPSLTYYAKDFDFDFHPANVALFRERLEEKFGTVQAMNDALGTDFGDFGTVVPPITEEARKSGNWSLWNEWRAHNDAVMADGYRMYRDVLKSVDPAGEISVSGTQSATPFDGFDWSRLAPIFGTMQGYGYNNQERKRISFNPSIINATPAGYGRSGRSVDYQVWNALTMNGAGHVLFWWIAFRNPDLSFSKSALDYKRVFEDMRRGVGLQYMQARRRFDPVAVLYSMNSLRAAYAEGKMEGRSGEFQDTENAVVKALVDAGFDPQFVSEREVAGGALEKKGIRALFLPMTLSLGYGDKPGGLPVKPALERFLASGGMLCATHPFKYDEFLRPRKPDGEFLSRVVSFDSVKDDLAGALERAGAVRPLVVSRPDGSPVPGVSWCVHDFPGGAGRIVTVLRKPVGSKEVLGADGVVHVVPDPSGGKELEDAVIDLSSFGRVFCYDMRVGARMSLKSGVLRAVLRGGDALSLVLLPYEVRAIRLSAGKEAGRLVVRWRLKTAGRGPLAPHVVRIEVGEVKDGRFIPDPALCRNEVSGRRGGGSVRIPLALEDEERSLIVKVTDVLSGMSASRPVR